MFLGPHILTKAYLSTILSELNVNLKFCRGMMAPKKAPPPPRFKSRLTSGPAPIKCYRSTLGAEYLGPKKVDLFNYGRVI